MLHLQHASLDPSGALSLLVFTFRSTLSEEKIAKIAHLALPAAWKMPRFFRIQRTIASNSENRSFLCIFFIHLVSRCRKPIPLGRIPFGTATFKALPQRCRLIRRRLLYCAERQRPHLQREPQKAGYRARGRRE